VEPLDAAGVRAHVVDGGALVVCLADAVSEAAIDAIAALAPRRVALRDAGFPDAGARLQAAARLRRAGALDVRGV